MLSAAQRSSRPLVLAAAVARVDRGTRALVKREIDKKKCKRKTKKNSVFARTTICTFLKSRQLQFHWRVYDNGYAFVRVNAYVNQAKPNRSLQPRLQHAIHFVFLDLHI